MSKQELAVILSKLKGFDNPDPNAEQYMTDSEVAAGLLWDAFMANDIKGKSICDLGCGTGILGIGALILGADRVIFVDKDNRAIQLAEHNLRLVEDHNPRGMESAEFFNIDICEFFTPTDAVIMNPPFGTRDKGADVRFLERAMQLSKVVYTIHKASTKDYLLKLIADKGWNVTYQKEVEMPLKNTMGHHEKRIQRVQVICLGLKKP